MDQRQLIAEYNKTHDKFNPKLFERKTEKFVQHIIDVIRTVEREGQFTFKLHSYQLITKYSQIRQILIDYENSLKKGKNKKKINIYEYVNLKDTDMYLLVVNFYIKVKDEEIINTIYICVPIYVNKYYFRISGNYYLPNLQIVHGSTFNSSTSKKIDNNVTLKTILMSIKTYRNTYPLITTGKEEISVKYFTITAFKKTFSIFKYILAKYGFYETLKFMNFEFIYLSQNDPNYADYYTFKAKKIYISCPKYIYDNDYMVQTFICTIFIAFNKVSKYQRVFSREYWLEMLGGEFGSYTTTKGESILASLEGIYDKATHDAIHLPEEYKSNIYLVLRWMMSEFNTLLIRDNLNLEAKRVRLEEYMASLYGMKIADTIHKFSDMGSNLDLELVLKYMRGLKPTYLIDAMIQCRFINCQNNVNDIDTWQVLKYTMNNLPGMDDVKKKDSKLPKAYSHVHYSHLGRLDPDSSPKSAPGVVGTFTPFCELEEDGSFTDYEEPLTWDNEFSKLMRNYKESIGMKESFMIREKLLNQDYSKEINEVSCQIKMYDAIVKPIIELEMNNKYSPRTIPLEAGGIIIYQE